MMLTSGDDSLIDCTEASRELDILPQGQSDLWEDCQGCLAQKVG